MRTLLGICILVFSIFVGSNTSLAAAAEQPSHLFFLFSYGRSVAPNRTHTFGFFAKMNEKDPQKIDQHVPISWLPVVTRPRQDPDGSPLLEGDGTVQIAPIAAGRVSWIRLGWSFSMKKTILFRRKMRGVNGIKNHGAFVITPAQFEFAKAFRDQLSDNVKRVLRGEPRHPERFYYRAVNQSLFSCPEGRVNGDINCFQAVLAAFGACETSGPLSGTTVTDYLLNRLKERKLVGETYLDTEEKIEPFLKQVLESEDEGEMDTPT